MKIEMEVKDAPKFRRIETIKVDNFIHPNISVQNLVTALKKNRPWGKIIDIRIDLR